MENQPERSASLRDEEKQKKKKTKKKKKKKTKKKKKKTSNDDSDDENGFADDDSNNNNKKSFRPENDHSESDKDEISDAGDTDFAFGDAISMVRILLSLCRSFYNILFIGFTYIPFLNFCLRKFQSVERKG